jgi:hypothetical protein
MPLHNWAYWAHIPSIDKCNILPVYSAHIDQFFYYKEIWSLLTRIIYIENSLFHWLIRHNNRAQPRTRQNNHQTREEVIETYVHVVRDGGQLKKGARQKHTMCFV